MVCLSQGIANQLEFFLNDKHSDGSIFLLIILNSIVPFSNKPVPDIVPNTNGLSVTQPTFLPDTTSHADNKFNCLKCLCAPQYSQFFYD